jgi:hypothetical protein
MARMKSRKLALHWHPLAKPLLQRFAQGRDRLLELRRSTLAFTEDLQRIVELFRVAAHSSAMRSRVCSLSASR